MNRRKVIAVHALRRRRRRVVVLLQRRRRRGAREKPMCPIQRKEIERSARRAEGGRRTHCFLGCDSPSLPQLIFDMSSMGGWWLVSLPALICSLQISSCPYQSISVHYVSERTNDVVLIHRTCTDFKPPSLSRSETLHSDHFILRHRRQTITWVSALLECSEREEIRPRRGRGGWNVFGSGFHLHLRPI